MEYGWWNLLPEKILDREISLAASIINTGDVRELTRADCHGTKLDCLNATQSGMRQCEFRDDTTASLSCSSAIIAITIRI